MSDEPFQWAGGRKFLLSVLGIACSMVLALLGKANAEVVGAIGAITLAYNGANTAVSWAWAKQQNENVNRQYDDIGTNGAP